MEPVGYVRELGFKPFLDTLDVLVQCSILLNSERDDFYPRVHDRHRRDMEGRMADLLPELLPGDFDMCRKAVERLLATLKRTDDAKEIRADVEDIRRRLIDQADSIFCLSLTGREQQLYEPKEPLFGVDVRGQIFRHVGRYCRGWQVPRRRSPYR